MNTNCFHGKLRIVSDAKAKLELKEKTQSQFCKPQSTPLAMRGRIKKERLVADGILKKVEYMYSD